MAWTSVSLMSTSAWNGPGGSPIISPSRWQTQVIDNLCVLALHNHSGSAGEGGTSFSSSAFPAIDNDAFSGVFPTASTNWLLQLQAMPNGLYPLYGYVSTSTQNATISYTTYLRSGTYKLEYLSGCGSAMGIITTCINGSSVFTTDRYNSGAELDAQPVSASFTASGFGERLLTFAIDTKNVSSNGYIARICHISLRRTGN